MAPPFVLFSNSTLYDFLLSVIYLFGSCLLVRPSAGRMLVVGVCAADTALGGYWGFFS